MSRGWSHAGLFTRAVLIISIGVPPAALAIALIGHPGPMIPFFGPDSARYLDLFTAIGVVTSLVLLIPAAISAYKCFGSLAATVAVLFLLGIYWICIHHVAWS